MDIGKEGIDMRVSLIENMKKVIPRLKSEGMGYVAFSLFDILVYNTKFLYFNSFLNRDNTFSFNGKEYPYLYHKYAKTWNCERSIEIPIIYDFVKQHNPDTVLEVGNVLSNYFPVFHDVVDKYEVADGVINVDVVDFNPHKKYSLIVSISTIEHVGFDEPEKEPLKAVKAVNNLKSLLKPDGMLIVTLPVGYNNSIDEMIDNNTMCFTQLFCFKRVKYDKWVSVEWDKLRDVRYNSPFYCANGLIVGVIK